MKVFIAGIDGYVGWALALYLQARGHDVLGVDDQRRREWVRDQGSCSVTPIPSLEEREAALGIQIVDCSVDTATALQLVDWFQPDCIVHLAEQPSPPWSMKGRREAVLTQMENVSSTLHLLWAIREKCPDAHLLKLGTMGEYGTPGCPIPEGYFPPNAELVYHYPDADPDQPLKRLYGLSGMPFPKQAGSFYHLSKVHDTNNIAFACRCWGLRATDVMQGVVYGSRTPQINGVNPALCTRLDVDECFGTVIHRFCAQAILGIPLTVYGKGEQKRGFLPLRDSIQCLGIVVENPPEKGEHRVLNQLEEIYSINYLAETVVSEYRAEGRDAAIAHVPNPRVEAEDHPYDVEHRKLMDLGYKPTGDLKGEVRSILEDMEANRIALHSTREAIMPKTQWR